VLPFSEGTANIMPIAEKIGNNLIYNNKIQYFLRSDVSLDNSCWQRIAAFRYVNRSDLFAGDSRSPEQVGYKDMW
jgi:hypothetical protein